MHWLASRIFSNFPSKIKGDHRPHAVAKNGVWLVEKVFDVDHCFFNEFAYRSVRPLTYSRAPPPVLCPYDLNIGKKNRPTTKYRCRTARVREA